MAFGVFESLAQAEQKGGKNAQNKAGDISPQQMEPQNTGIAVKQDDDGSQPGTDSPETVKKQTRIKLPQKRCV